MSQSTIKTFRTDADRYRHVIDTRTDDVLLQVWTGLTWATILRYDSGANVWNWNTGGGVGYIRQEEGHWVFTATKGHRIVGRPYRLADSLLDTEVEVSKWWLSAGRLL